MFKYLFLKPLINKWNLRFYKDFAGKIKIFYL